MRHPIVRAVLPAPSPVANIRRRIDPWLCFALGALLVLLSACAGWRDRASSQGKDKPPGEASWLRLAQIGHGPSAAFALCNATTCPQVTPKTIAGQRAELRQDSTASAQAPGPIAISGDRASLTPVPSTSEPIASRPAASQVAADTSMTGDEAPLRHGPSSDLSISVRFPFGQATLSAEAKAVLDAAVGTTRSVERLHIAGRTDSAGSKASNDALALARARAVREHLRQRLAPWPATVDIEAAGGCCFAETNNTAVGRSANRRVEVTFFTKGDPQEQL